MGKLMALPGTLLPPGMFHSVALPNGWHWSPVDWLREPSGGDLLAMAETLGQRWSRESDSHRLLVGHSAGGVIAMQMAADLGDRLAGLILIDSGASALNHGDPDLPQRLRAQWGDDFIEAFLLRCVGQNALHQYGKKLRDYAHAAGPERAYRAMVSLRRQDLTQRLGEIRCPTLIIHGTRDPARRREHAEALANGIAGAELRWLDAGHTPMLECPRMLAKVVADFLDTLDNDL